MPDPGPATSLTLHVEIDGQERADLASNLVRFEIVEAERHRVNCNADFLAWGGATFLYFDRQEIGIGRTLTLKLGNAEAFRGAITSLGGSFFEDAGPLARVFAEHVQLPIAPPVRSAHVDLPGPVVLRYGQGLHSFDVTGREAGSGTAGSLILDGKGISQINLAIHTGGIVDLRGIGPLFSGQYSVVKVRHLFEAATGFRSEFTAAGQR